MEPRTYAQAGVDIEKAEAFVARLKGRARRTGHDRLLPAAGGYACVQPVNREKAVAFTTDGVGTKLLLAVELGVYDTIGIDLVAMCANDLICTGATPSLFLDYFATGALEPGTADSILEGIVEGCDRASMILAGGETAEMPDLYQPDHFDLAGFAAGFLDIAHLITGQNLSPGQKLVGVASSGLHSNGFSLARKLLPADEETRRTMLAPTYIYVSPVLSLFEKMRPAVRAIAHITGGGWRNLLRLNRSVGFDIHSPLPVPPILESLRGRVSDEELYCTFNMGMGLALVLSEGADEAAGDFSQAGFPAAVVGEVTANAGRIRVSGMNFELKAKGE